MTYATKINMALGYIGKSKTWLAEQLGSSPQAFNQRYKTGKWTLEELEKMGEVMGGSFVCGFEFPDGTKV